jgi:hypothetical protein
VGSGAQAAATWFIPEIRIPSVSAMKCIELQSAGLTANLSGVLRALRQQLLRAQQQMEQIDAAIAALASLNVTGRTQELAAAAGGKIAADAEQEMGKSRRLLHKKEIMQ